MAKSAVPSTKKPGLTKDLIRTSIKRAVPGDLRRVKITNASVAQAVAMNAASSVAASVARTTPTSYLWET